MSMKFTPFYGLSIKDTAREVEMDGNLVLQALKDVLGLIDEGYEELELFYEFFYIEDEFDDNSDYVYGIPTYDIEIDKLDFNKMNTSDNSFVSSIDKFICTIKNSNIIICEDVMYILQNYRDNIINRKFSPKIYSVYI